MSQTAVVTAEKKTRKPKGSINWLKLGEGKDPVFGDQYFLYANTGTKEVPKHDYQVGALAGINSFKEGKKYSWFVEGQEDERNHFTHYASCSAPVE
jgi:hypothetical protein